MLEAHNSKLRNCIHLNIKEVTNSGVQIPVANYIDTYTVSLISELVQCFVSTYTVCVFILFNNAHLISLHATWMEATCIDAISNVQYLLLLIILVFILFYCCIWVFCINFAKNTYLNTTAVFPLVLFVRCQQGRFKTMVCPKHSYIYMSQTSWYLSIWTRIRNFKCFLSSLLLCSPYNHFIWFVINIARNRDFGLDWDSKRMFFQEIITIVWDQRVRWTRQFYFTYSICS